MGGWSQLSVAEVWNSKRHQDWCPQGLIKANCFASHWKKNSSRPNLVFPIATKPFPGWALVFRFFSFKVQNPFKRNGVFSVFVFPQLFTKGQNSSWLDLMKHWPFRMSLHYFSSKAFSACFPSRATKWPDEPAGPMQRYALSVLPGEQTFLLLPKPIGVCFDPLELKKAQTHSG